MIVRPAWLAALALCVVADADALDLPTPGGARFHIPATSLKEIRYRSTLRQQYDFSCGSAALATMLTHHYGRPFAEQAVFEQMYLHGDRDKIRRDGFSMLDMQRFLAGQGLRADGFRLPLARLAEAGLPAIVLVADKGYHHFVVVKGLADGRVLIGDPSSGTRAMSQAAFDTIWSGRLLFVIHGFKGPVRFNAAADWRAAPAAPLAEGIGRGAIAPLTLPKHGPGGF